MKKTVLLFLFLSSALLLFAQPGEKKWLLSADAGGFVNQTGYTSIGDSAFKLSYETNSIRITPRLGYFVTPWMAAGLDMTLGTTNTKYSSGITSRIDWKSYRVFARGYFTGGRIAPFIDAGAGKVKRVEKLTYAPNTFTYRYNGWDAYAGIGLAIFAGEKAAFEGTLMYYTEQFREEENTPVQAWKYNGVQLNFGVSFYL